MSIKLLIIYAGLLVASLSYGVAGFEPYQVDRTIFNKFPDIAADYVRLQQLFDQGELPNQQHEMRLKVMRALLAKNPSWIDGYWLLGAEAFILGSHLDAVGDKSGAKTLLKETELTCEACLKMDPHQAMCQFFLASALAKNGAIEGVLTSLNNAARVQKLWQEVLQSKTEFWFRPNSSLQGSVRYGLGLFYRLIPDHAWTQALFNIRGDINAAVAFHRESMQVNPADPCTHLMLAVALLCRSHGEHEHADFREGMDQLHSAGQLKTFDLSQRFCQNDLAALEKNPDLACEYN